MTFPARAAALACAAMGAGAGALTPASAQAGVLALCDRQVKLSAADEDVLFRFGAVVKKALEGSGARVAIVSRSGLDLDRFGIRYSHAGLALQASPNAPWSVRQLYYACDEGRPRLFDQGLSGFLLGTENPDTGYLSVVLLPSAQADAAEAAALDNPRALSLLAGTYSANAYPFSRTYQNCNGWLVELLANAWAPGWPLPASTPPAAADGEPPVEADTPPDAQAARDPRTVAQHWLRTHGYRPSVVEAGAFMPLAWFIPFVHQGDHPQAELRRRQFTTSLPAGLEAFVHASLPGASRMEFCHAGHRVVVHHGWDDIAAGCVAGPGDETIALE